SSSVFVIFVFFVGSTDLTSIRIRPGMNVVSLISKKRDGGELTEDEIGSLISGYVRGDVPDYQMASWAMAVYLRGMTVAEIAALTEHMLHSGVTFEWPAGESP